MSCGEERQGRNVGVVGGKSNRDDFMREVGEIYDRIEGHDVRQIVRPTALICPRNEMTLCLVVRTSAVEKTSV